MANGLTPKTDFFSHLKYQKTSHVIVTGETDDFDDVTIAEWRNEGFAVRYIGFGDGGADFVRRVQALANEISVGEQYAIVAFGSPASPLLSSLRHLPRLLAFVAYYPPQIPSQQHTTYPASVQILIHLCASSTISVTKRPEVLGLQGSKTRTVQKRVDSGAGLGGEIWLGKKGVDGDKVRTYVYEGVQPGFAEGDVDQYDSVTKEMAFSRSLAVVRAAFGVPPIDLEGIRDEFMDDVARDPGDACKALPSDASRINLPTLTGGFDASGLRRFYADLFGPSAPFIRARLMSRTVGTTQVVDEMLISFKHDREVQWILPGVPPSGRDVRIVMVSVVCIKAGRCVAERVYWDQASVLVQIGMLDPSLVPEGFAGASKGRKKKLRMPVVGAEQANAVEWGEDWDGDVNTLCNGVAGTNIS
ncbi:hypothetical protein CAC42_1055 [Sphaceloma murrayae]|uniref:SnoaL-like domain-containing protein n=1 Tax=Sphaceloma murrayae TaxID=2082308 RepID=A0A2K1R1W5_9PEZI|nr:hypothetical protein CAC42_1055 [Sphaceloma murrayae]